MEISNGTLTASGEIIAANLDRPLHRTVTDRISAAAPHIQAGVPGLLAGQFTWLADTLTDALALDAIYKATDPITLTGTLTEIRRNLLTNPVGTPVVAGSGWELRNRWFGSGANAGTNGTVYSAQTLPDGTNVPSFWRKTWTNVSGPAFADIAFQLYNGTTARGPVDAGKAYTVQLAWRRSWSAPPAQCYFRCLFYAGNAPTGVQVGPTLNGPPISAPPPGVWQQDAITFTVPAGATHVEVVLYYGTAPGDIAINDTMDATACVPEKADHADPPFWGSYSPDPGLTPEWLGTPNAAASRLLSNDLPSGLDGFKHQGVGSVRMTAERAQPGRPAKWLVTVDVREVP